MSAYYNEIDSYAAQWLRKLIDAGHIAPGDVDERSIVDVRSDDLRGYDQCHFFAGIGGWSLALRLAGWPDARAVWTGSCPCQPLSSAGKRKGHADRRHLWPALHTLIAQRRPAVFFGEQVASKDGREWLSGVRADFESARYAVGAADIATACIAAPVLGHRLYFVAAADRDGLHQQDVQAQAEQPAPRWHNANGCGADVFASGIPVVGKDGRRRMLEPGIEPLADGFPGRLEQVRAYGNAIIPQVAAEFIRASVTA